MKSSFTGVRRERNKWRADIQIRGKKKFLGYFDSEVSAADAYNKAIDKNLLPRKKNILP